MFHLSQTRENMHLCTLHIITLGQGVALYLRDLHGEGAGEGDPGGDHREHHGGVVVEAHVYVH